MIFYGAVLLSFKSCPIKVLTISIQTEVISVRNLRMRIISGNMIFFMLTVLPQTEVLAKTHVSDFKCRPW